MENRPRPSYYASIILSTILIAIIIAIGTTIKLNASIIGRI